MEYAALLDTFKNTKEKFHNAFKIFRGHTMLTKGNIAATLGARW
jgi:hypothetical protein